MDNTASGATDPALLAKAVDDLERAELIILTMLNAMTDDQKVLVHRQL